VTTTAEVREALAIAGSYCGREVKPYVPTTITTGSGYVARREFDPRYVFSGAKVVYPFLVRFYFNATSMESAQQDIDELCDVAGSGSFLAAVQDGANWPAYLVDYAQVTNVGEPNDSTVDGTNYLTVDFDIEVVW
jgi:hypothetical protein